MSIQCGSRIPSEDFPPYKFLSLSPEVAHCSLAQHDTELGSKGWVWRVAGSPSTVHPDFPVACCTDCTERVRSSWCSAGTTKLHQLQQDTRRQKLVCMVVVRNETHGIFSMLVTPGQNTSVAKAERKSLSQSSNKQLVVPLMKAHKNHPS